MNISLIKTAKTNEMTWKAKRPKDSSLNVEKALEILNNNGPLKIHQAIEVMRKDPDVIKKG